MNYQHQTDETLVMLTLAGEDMRVGTAGAWYYVLSQSAAENVLRKYAGAYGTFDPDGFFYDPQNAEAQRIYHSDIDVSWHKASDISKNGIEIQKR